MKKIPARSVALISIVVGAIAIGAIVASGQSGKKAAESSIQINKERGAPPLVAVSKAESGRKPLMYYTGSVRKDLFSAPAPAKPKEEPKPEPTPPALPPSPPPVIVNPFADYVYSGTVNVGGRTLALVENTKTKDGLFLAVGDSFIGGTIGQIGDRMLTVDVAGRQEMIAKRDDFKLTPLDKSAPFLQGAPAAAAPSAPGQTPPVPGAAPSVGPGGPGMMRGMPQNIQDRFRQRMENMSPDQKARMEERMNRWRDREFEGGGRRRDGDGERRRERRNNDG